MYIQIVINDNIWYITGNAILLFGHTLTESNYSSRRFEYEGYNKDRIMEKAS
jgi:hypothetical protein